MLLEFLASAVLLGLTTSTSPVEAVHPGDTVAITVFNHPELSPAPLTVDASGMVSVPLAGVIDARDATTHVLAERIQLRLRAYIPLVAVDVRLLAQGTNIFITGDYGGVVKYSPGESLLAALQDATSHQGTSTAPIVQTDLRHGPVDLHDVQILRDGATLGRYDVDTMMAQGDTGPAILPGDTLRLKDKPLRVTVRGEVKMPGVAYLDADEPLLGSLTQTGGPLDTAWTTHVQLTRAGVTRSLALGDPIFAAPPQSGDALLVPPAPTVSVLGMVAKPGTTVLRGDASLLDALYEAGGPQPEGNLRSVAVEHGGQRVEYDLTKLNHGAHDQNPMLADGDTVFVPVGHKLNFAPLFQALTGAWMLKQL